jgi:serine/threonine-protein kinase
VIPTYRYNDALSRATIALSPDGELLAFVARRDGVGRLFLRDLRSYEIIEVPSSDRAMMPFFSPDGRQVGFMANGKLWRAAISGGVPVEIGNVTSAAVGASWGADGTIVYAPSYASRLWKIPAAGGVAEPLTTLRLEAGEASHRWPHVLPDGSGVLFSIKPSTAQTLNEGRIAIASLATGEYEVVLEGGTAARYIDGGYLAYAREGRLFAATFDLATRQVGSPVPVLENLVSHPTNGAAWFALASNGTIAWVPGKEVLARTELQWLTQDGTVIPFTLVDDVGGLAISPDGDRMLMQVPAANDKLWLLDLGEQPLMSRFSTGPGNDFGAAWSPDGQWVVFSSDRAGGDGVLYRLPASGGSTAEPLDAGDGFVVRVDVAGQARLLAFDRSGPDSASDIWVAAINPDGTLAAAPKAVTNTPFNEIAPALSTDGTLVAFASDESGESEIYVSRYPPMGSKRLVSVDGGLSPLWRPDTHTLLYWNDEGLHSVEIIATSEVRAGARDLLVGSGSYIDRAYAYMPDGSRLLLASTSDAAAWDKSTINVMLNWFPDLERRVASGR